MSDSKNKTGVLTVDVVERAAAGEVVDWNSYRQIEDDAAGLLVQRVGERKITCLSKMSATGDSIDVVHGRFPAIHLAGVKYLSPNAAKALAQHKGDLYLDGLTTLPLPLAKALADIEGALYLSGVTEISDAAAAAMAKHRAGLRLDGLKLLSDTAAASLSEYTEWPRGWLSLKGLTSLSDAAAESLVNGVLNLDVSGVELVSERAAWTLRSGGMVSLGKHAFSGLSVATRLDLSKRKDWGGRGFDMVSLNDLTQLSESDTILVADFDGRVLLPDLETLPVEVAAVLAKHRGTRGGLYLGPGLTKLSDAAAEAIASYRGRIWFAGLSELSVNVAEALAKVESHLFLLGLKELPAETAQALAKHRNDLSLNGLIRLSEAAAAALAKFEGDLFLDSLTELTEQEADAIAGHRGELSLGGLGEVTDAVATALVKHQGLVFLYSHTRISAVAANALAMSNYHILKQGGRLGDELKPVEQDRERRVSLAELDDIMSSGAPSDTWSSFRSKIQDGDEIWQYCSDCQSWDFLAGRAGYKITRGGKIVDGILTRMN
jgi:hypothetical protein